MEPQPINKLLQTIPLKSVSALPVQTQPVSSEENQLIKAVQGVRINQATLEEIKQALRYVIMKVGLRAQNWPTDEEKGLLITHILNEFGTHTTDEVRLAFDMAITGKLNVEANCYENFSCLYFSSIMNAYRVWAAEAYKQSVKPAPPVQKIYTDEELLDIRRGDMEATFQRMLSGRQNVVPPDMFEFMVSEGFITEETDVVKWIVDEIGKGRKNLYVKQ